MVTNTNLDAYFRLILSGMLRCYGMYLCFENLARNFSDVNFRSMSRSKIVLAIFIGSVVQGTTAFGFSASWVTTILYNYGATLCELRYNKQLQL